MFIRLATELALKTLHLFPVPFMADKKCHQMKFAGLSCALSLTPVQKNQIGTVKASVKCFLLEKNAKTIEEGTRTLITLPSSVHL